MPAPGPEALRLAPFGPEDAKAVAALHACCFDDGWSAEAFEGFAGNCAYPGLLAWQGTHLAGFLVISIAADESEILTIGVALKQRGQGVALAMLRQLQGDLIAIGVTALFLEVGTSNERARTLYDRFGFVTVGARPDYYERRAGREDAIIMKLSLSD